MAKSKNASNNPPSVYVECAYTSMVKTTDLRPNPKNPNKHPPEQIDLLAKIITVQGWRAPITVSKRSGFVVRGHGRLMAANQLGLETVPVDLQDYPSDELELADLIADNRLSELSDLSIPEIKDLLADLDTGALDMDVTGFCSEEIERLMNGPVVEYDEDPPAAKPLRVSGEIPAEVWLMQREALVSSLDSSASQFGIYLKWPSDKKST
jgi:hypothetical protein